MSEPVAWMSPEGWAYGKHEARPPECNIPLYTHQYERPHNTVLVPCDKLAEMQAELALLKTHPAKELTDEEIEGWITEWAKDLYGTLYIEPTDHQRTMAIKMARAILRKAQEK